MTAVTVEQDRDPERDLRAVALLEEPIRRRLYEWVVEHGLPVGRDEAAEAVGISRGLAAFHLDRLVDAGLLRAEYRRLTGRTGPGAGRPAKLYLPSDRPIELSLPRRRYELAARLLADGLEASEDPRSAVGAAARTFGESLGRTRRDAPARRDGTRRIREAVEGALRDEGYEPAVDASGVIRLRNCPFHALVEEHRDLVCGMNLALLQGLLAGLRGEDRFEASLEEQPGFCCVALRSRRPGFDALPSRRQPKKV